MPAKKDSFWEEALKSLKANNRTWGAGRITQALEQAAAKEGRGDAPGERWVGNFLKKLKEDPSWLQQEREYRTFYWPESMGRGDLPWEASRSALELLSFLDSQGRTERPLVRMVRWFWRVSEAAPCCHVHGRWIAAQMLTSRELAGERVSARGVEWFLAYRPWESEAQRKSYRDAYSRAGNPIPLMDARLTLSKSELEKDPELRSLMESLFGKSLEEVDAAVFFWTTMPEGVDRKIIRSEENNG